MNGSGRHMGFWAGALAAGTLLLGAACTSGGVSQADYDKAQNDLKAAQAQIGQLQSQPALKAPAPATVIQVGNLQLAPAAQAITGWDTPASKMLGIELMATLDSSGPAAWDAAKHPLVYIATDGPGYGSAERGNLKLSEQVKNPGIQIIDATTQEPVASVFFDLGAKATTENHGAGVSADGKWIYTQGRNQDRDVLLVINAKTLKIDKILKSRVHHVREFKDAATGKELVLVDGWGTFFALDPNDNQRVVAALDPANLRGSGYLAFVDPSGKWMFVSVRTGFSSEGGVAVVDLKTWAVATRIATKDSSPIWVEFSNKEKVAYVSGGHDSTVAKIDMSAANPAQWKLVGMARAGTEGPYGINLSADEKTLITIGKGEGSHNLGDTEGYLDPARMTNPDQAVRPSGVVYTGCVRADHGIVNPLLERNELWISCNSSFETVVLDTKGMKVKSRIPSPQGGSTHGGAFVRYNADFTGELLVDTNGFHGSALKAKLALLQTLAALP